MMLSNNGQSQDLEQVTTGLKSPRTFRPVRQPLAARDLTDTGSINSLSRDRPCLEDLLRSSNSTSISNNLDNTRTMDVLL